MNTALTDEQIRKYRDHGYLKIDQFLDAGEVAELKGAVLEAAGSLGKNKVAGGGNNDIQDDDQSFYGKVFTQKLNLWRINPTVKHYMLNPDLGKMLCRLGGVKGYRVWHDQTLIKEPFGNPTGFHLDNPYWSFTSRDAMSIWIALEDATLENGCMWFQPGSQKLARYNEEAGRFDNVGIGHNIFEICTAYPEMAKIDPVPVPMKAGDCSFHNGLLSHGAGPNMTRKRRIAMTCAYMPEGATFNGSQNVLSREYFQSLKKGDVLANDDWNPIVGKI
jgi:ectoine hydroxylase-related dioxygenase (phytanoyl-CoA dioxygenase family)